MFLSSKELGHGTFWWLLLIYPSETLDSCIKSACNLLLWSRTEVMGIVNSRVVSHSMQANVFELNRGLEHRSFLNWGRETFIFSGSLPKSTNKPSLCRVEPYPFTLIKQTNKQTFPWTQPFIFAKRKRKGVGFFSTLRGALKSKPEQEITPTCLSIISSIKLKTKDMNQMLTICSQYKSQ